VRPTAVSQVVPFAGHMTVTRAIANRLGPHDASVLRSLQGEEHVVRLALKSDIELVHWGGCLSTARPRALSSDHTLLLEHTDLAL